MALYEKLKASMQNRDVKSYLSCLHEDFKVVFHKSGNIFNKGEWFSMATEMIANEKFIQETSRCIYENEDILVEHRISTYTDGERSATMLVHLKKDGLLWRTETGVTPLSKK